MNKKGQALVEFIIILPLLVLIVTSIIDITNVYYKKYQLENHLDYVTELYTNDKKSEIDKFVQNNYLTVNYENNLNQTTIFLKKNVDIITPGLQKILSNQIEVKRVIYDE